MSPASTIPKSDTAELKAASKRAKPAADPGYVDRTLGCRYELKYLISEAQTEAMFQYLRSHLDLDRYSKLQPQGFYPIVSLYVDSPGLQLARETLEGKQNRYKLRIRSYSDDKQYPAFFEIKRRINRVILKSRARVRHEDIPRLLQGHQLPKQDFHTDLTGLNQFQLYAKSIKAGPLALVRYLRKAYEGGSHNRVRVTFDRELCYKVTDRPEVTLGGSGWQANHFTMKGVILEIKFTGTYPIWLSRMVACFGLEARGISKYASSVTQSNALGFCGPTLGP